MGLKLEAPAAASQPLWYPFVSVFDLALDLEHSSIAILSAVTLLALAPTLVKRYLKQPIVAQFGLLLWLKIAVSSLVAIVDVLTYKAWQTLNIDSSEHPLIASCVSCVADISLLAVLVIEHQRARRSSALLSIWTTLGLSSDIIRAQFFMLDSSRRDIMVFTCITAALKFALVVLLEIPKWAWLDESVRKKLSREQTAGFWCRSLLIWLKQTLCIGYSENLTLDDIEDLSDEFSSEKLAVTFSRQWDRADKSTPYCLLSTLFTMFKQTFLDVIIPRLVLIAFLISQAPYFQRLLLFLEHDDDSYSSKAKFIAGVVFIYLGITISGAMARDLAFRSATLVRGTLVAVISAKSLNLPHSEAQKFKATRLASNEAEEVAGTIPVFHDIWSGALELAISIFFLEQLIGDAAYVALLPGLATATISWYNGNDLASTNAQRMEAAEGRRRRTATMISQLHSIKMIGLEDIVGKAIQNCFENEIKAHKCNRYWMTLLVGTVVFFNTLSGPIVVGGSLLWASRSQPLTAPKAFAIVACMARLAEPLDRLVHARAFAKSMLDGLQRIQEYLLLEDIQDPRLPSFLAAREKQLTNSSVARGKQPMPSANDTVISLADTTIMVQETKTNVLQNVNMRIRRYELVMIAGNTGSGKSSLLRFLVGETASNGGNFVIEPGAAAYCDQKAWLQYGTVRCNIVGEERFNQEWYGTVLKACCLDTDLQQLPSGDQSIVGSNGVNLSGGQRQRIALARALYSRAPYLVLDDVFASLDRQTSSEVFTRLFGNDGLMRLMPTTTIMATHSIPFLQAADKVFFINQNGRVIMHEDSTSAAFRRMLREISTNVSTHITENEEENEALNTATRLLTASKDAQGDDEVSYLQRLKMYLNCFSRLDLIAFFLCAFIGAFVEALPETYVRFWIGTVPNFALFTIGCITLATAAGLCTLYALGSLVLKMAPESSKKLHEELLSTFSRMKLHFLTNTDHNTLVNRICDDLTHFTRQTQSGFSHVTYETFYIAIRYSLIFAASRCSPVLAPIVMAAFALIHSHYSLRSQTAKHLKLETSVPIISQLTETSKGLRHIRALGLQQRALKKNFKLLDTSQKTFLNAFNMERWLDLQVDSIQSIVAVVLVIRCVCYKGSVSAADIGLALAILMTALKQNTLFAVEAWSSHWSSMGSLVRMRKFIENTPVEKEISGDELKLPAEWPTKGVIEMKNVYSRYDVAITAPRALKNINLTLPANEKIGFSGRTGCGKTSLLLTLLNFLECDGTILIDGQDISRLPQKYLRQHITTISQDPIELDGTVHYNLCPWTMEVSTTKGNVHLDSVDSILRRLGLREKIDMNGGLRAPMSNMKFSQGELQLFGIARSMLRALSTNSRVVIMDEPTSDLDDATAEMVKVALKEAFKHHTVLMVAHRPESLDDATMIVHMINGRVFKTTYPGSPDDEQDTTATNPWPGVNAPPRDIHPHLQALLDRQKNPNLPPLPDPNQKGVDALMRKFKDFKEDLARKQGESSTAAAQGSTTQTLTSPSSTTEVFASSRSNSSNGYLRLIGGSFRLRQVNAGEGSSRDAEEASASNAGQDNASEPAAVPSLLRTFLQDVDEGSVASNHSQHSAAAYSVASGSAAAMDRLERSIARRRRLIQADRARRQAGGGSSAGRSST